MTSLCGRKNESPKTDAQSLFLFTLTEIFYRMAFLCAFKRIPNMLTLLVPFWTVCTYTQLSLRRNCNNSATSGQYLCAFQYFSFLWWILDSSFACIPILFPHHVSYYCGFFKVWAVFGVWIKCLKWWLRHIFSAWLMSRHETIFLFSLICQPLFECYHETYFWLFIAQ